MRVLHLVSEYSAHEAIGRTIAEAAARVPGEHHLLTARMHDGADRFASATVSDGSMAWFPAGEPDAVRAALDTARPDLVHLHGGALLPFLAGGPALRAVPMVETIYAWPRVPGWTSLRRASLQELRVSNVLRARVLATTVLGRRSLVGALRRARARAVLSPDPEVLTRLRGVTGLPVVALPSGASPDHRRAGYRTDAPVVLFAGRAETVRGIDVLLDAMPGVAAEVPGVRFRLLLLPTPELGRIVARIADRGLADRVELSTEPVADLHAELAAAQVGVWPFLFDYTTSPPAMALVEAMSVGLPVVGTDVACVRAVLDPDRGGLVVPPGRPDALAAALVRLLTDRELWDRSAVAGVDVTRARCGWDNAARTTELVYSSIGS